MSPARRPPDKARGRGARPVEPKPARRRSAPRRELDGVAPPAPRCVLRLYVTGASRISQRAIERVRAICERDLHGEYDLEVIDIYQLPALAKDEQIVATPTLIRVLPAPLRRFIGDLSKAESVLFGLDLRVEKR